MSNVHVMDHPLIQHKIGIIRREETGSKDFRMMIGEIAMLMCYEATRELKLTDIEIETPICTATVKELQGKKLAVVPILRAGLGMVDGMLSIIPSAKIGHIGLYRDENKQPVEYLVRMPPELKNRRCIIVDPMLATGNSSVHAVNVLLKRGAMEDNIKFLALVAAPEGVEVFFKAHPNIDLYVASVDEKLDKNAYIVPGLGDAGDRIFGTL